MMSSTIPMDPANEPGGQLLPTNDPETERRRATKERLARYRRRMELHIQAARVRRAAPRRPPPELVAAARAVIEKYGRIEADGGLWVTVGKEVRKGKKPGLRKLVTALEGAGLVCQDPGQGQRSGVSTALRFVVALEPRQALRRKLVEKELAMRWETAEVAEFCFVVGTGPR